MLIMQTLMKSPLNYPGAKRWLVRTLFNMIPEGTRKIVSPFMGGGVFEINAALRGYDVYGCDTDTHLVDFYQAFVENPGQLFADAQGILAMHTPKTLRKLKREHRKQGYKKITPALFWVFNRLSYNGFTFKSITVVDYEKHAGRFYRKHEKWNSCTRRVFTMDAFQYLKLPSLSIACQDFQDTLREHTNGFLYCDPPYWKEGDAVYRCHFDHERLHTELTQKRCWALSYDDCEWVRDTYKGYRMLEFQRRYKVYMKSNRPLKTELLIVSDDIVLPPKQLTFALER